MKKITYLLLAIVVLLGLFVFFKDQITGLLGGNEQSNWKKIKGDATQVTTVFHGKTNTFVYKNGTWFAEPGDLLADKEKVMKMVNALSTNRSFTLISSYPIYEKYELTPSNRVSATLTIGGKIRSLDIGKTSSTYSHSFVLLNGDSNIYQTEGYLAPDFNQDLDQVRDRNIFSFKLEEVSSVELKNSAGAVLSLTKASEAFSTNTNLGGTPKTFWKDVSGGKFKDSEINDLISIVSHLSASGFPTEFVDASAAEKSPTTYQITLKSGSKTFFLKFLNAKEKDKTDSIAFSSERKETFLVSEDNVKRLTPSFDKLRN
jgi:hypothetical protein